MLCHGIKSPQLAATKKKYNATFKGKTHLKTKRSISLKQQKRFLNIHEYQGQQLMREFEITVPRGAPATTPEEAEKVCKELGGRDWIVKAQILAGGRGKGIFKNGFRGGVHLCQKITDVVATSKKMLGTRLITKQTGEEGRPVNVVYLAERHYIRRETYFAITMDRTSGGPLIIASSQGGVDIETVAVENPNAIVKVPIDIQEGFQQKHADILCQALDFVDNKADATQQMKRLYDLFIKKDCTLIEVNPFVETHDGRILALDSKINFDENALFRHKDLESMRDPSQEDPREVAAAKHNLNYIGLDGNIACLVNGAGLAMATMDIIKLHGGEPANFLDVGGSASPEQVTEAFKILNADPRVHAILVNIFGGIMRCDVIADGIIRAARQINLKKPVIIRLQGTNVDKGKELIEASNLKLVSSDDLDDAARKAVKIANIAQMASEAHLGVNYFELPL